MTRIHIPFFCSFVLGIVANGCVANAPDTSEGPTRDESAPLLCSGGDYAVKYYRDNDHDGHFAKTGTLFCNPPGAGWSDEPGDDCNDNDASIHPGATEIVGDGKDSNCDGKDPEAGGTVSKNYRMISLRIFHLCDSDGTNCGTETVSQAQAAVDSMNSYLYRSNSNLRVKLTDATSAITSGQITAAPFGNIKSDYWNSACKPVADLGSYPESANAATLCTATTENTGFSADFKAFAKAVEAAGDVPVFARGGTEEVVWKDGMWKRAGWGGGYSSCSGDVVMLSDHWSGGTFMAHEVGHYYCLPHTMSEGKAAPVSLADAATMIKAQVASGIAPTASSTILDNLWNPDRSLSGYTGDLAYLQSYPINDTPPDPGKRLWRAAHGSTDVENDASTDCVTSSSSFDVPVKLGAPYNNTYTYTIKPDRTLIMSYYKGCFDYRQHYSPNEVSRMQAAAGASGHRPATTVSAAGWESTADVSIPLRTLDGTLNWASSSIPVGLSGTIKRIKLHVDASNPDALNVRLVAPNGTVLNVLSPSATGYVKGIYYLNGAGLPKYGTWKLQVASDAADVEGNTGTLYGWRLEFE